jgi:hypothetical protein
MTGNKRKSTQIFSLVGQGKETGRKKEEWMRLKGHAVCHNLGVILCWSSPHRNPRARLPFNGVEDRGTSVLRRSISSTVSGISLVSHVRFDRRHSALFVPNIS